MLTAKVKIENFKEKMTKILNFELQMSYIGCQSKFLGLQTVKMVIYMWCESHSLRTLTGHPVFETLNKHAVADTLNLMPVLEGNL